MGGQTGRQTLLLTMNKASYPFLDPKNNAGRAANRKASDEYQCQEEEASDFRDWSESWNGAVEKARLREVGEHAASHNGGERENRQRLAERAAELVDRGAEQSSAHGWLR
ncbi:hypothetical protein [Streptomyces sp. NPDC017991]|uniref:hypothetical protein n=1 Tax=Streptomyces sp. NPDC017991 TaxID=3365026 RepID=UPI0037888940